MTSSRDDEPLTSGTLPEGAWGNPDPVPNDVTAAAKAAFESATRGEVAVLVHDSLVDAGEPAQKHVLRFEHPQMVLQVHVSVEPGGTLIHGVVDRSGPTRATVHFQEADKTMAEPVDGAIFEFPPLSHGLVRISLEDGSEPTIWTDWFRI